MTGPEHYREAERLVEQSTSEDDYILLLKAKVHATLALTAIQAERWIDGDAHPDWPSVIA